ncbi:hypothetical protein L0657_14655 [Dyadobacter sp. CY345]|uniref:tetratricopeptide repeat protein n=1 Tax=Dyadobacter sp. CY345 TaxID=2909335 RepID=UPI001F2A08D5|nr:tetratricopeptide repeat protein [Dyadobacter sp. CY345]MCF2445206.1 hypothetical protein [Dyadobacter sp. CY345]
MEERIDDYFKKQLPELERKKFEEDLKSSPELAESVAFYLVTHDAAKQNAREKELIKRHAEWQKLGPAESKTINRQLIYYTSAAVILIALGLGWFFLKSGTQDRELLANAYVEKNFSTLSVQMDGDADSLQQAVGAYNMGEFSTAENQVEAILKRDPENAEAQKLAGIVSLKLKNYDKAITYFHQLGEQENLFSNPGKFYEAIAHIQRGLPLDKKLADSLLEEVIDSNLDGKEEAEKWVK